MILGSGAFSGSNGALTLGTIEIPVTGVKGIKVELESEFVKRIGQAQQGDETDGIEKTDACTVMMATADYEAKFLPIFAGTAATGMGSLRFPSITYTLAASFGGSVRHLVDATFRGIAEDFEATPKPTEVTLTFKYRTVAYGDLGLTMGRPNGVPAQV